MSKMTHSLNLVYISKDNTLLFERLMDKKSLGFLLLRIKIEIYYRRSSIYLLFNIVNNTSTIRTILKIIVRNTKDKILG